MMGERWPEVESAMKKINDEYKRLSKSKKRLDE